MSLNKLLIVLQEDKSDILEAHSPRGQPERCQNERTEVNNRLSRFGENQYVQQSIWLLKKENKERRLLVRIKSNLLF